MSTCPCCGAPRVPNKISVDLSTNTVIGPRGAVTVQARSAELAAALLGGHVRSQAQLETAIWGTMMPNSRSLLAVHVHHLRHGCKQRGGIRSIGLDVQNVHRQGYRLIEM